MNTVDSKSEILNAINKTLGQFEFESGPITDYAGYEVTCELAGCDRTAMYYINSPVYDGRYNTIYTYACVLHVGALTLTTAAKWVEKELDQHYCAVCEASAYACECDPKEAIGVKRKIERKASGICSVCGGETEHDWETHVAEMKAGY